MSGLVYSHCQERLQVTWHSLQLSVGEINEDHAQGCVLFFLCEVFSANPPMLQHWCGLRIQRAAGQRGAPGSTYFVCVWGVDQSPEQSWGSADTPFDGTLTEGVISLPFYVGSYICMQIFIIFQESRFKLFWQYFTYSHNILVGSGGQLCCFKQHYFLSK